MPTICPDCDALLDGMPVDYAYPNCGGMRRSVSIHPGARAVCARFHGPPNGYHHSWRLAKELVARSSDRRARVRIAIPGTPVTGWAGVWSGLTVKFVTTVVGLYVVTKMVTITKSG